MANRSPLHDLHAGNGALFGTYHDWEIVEDFGSSLEEYRAVRESAAVLDMSYLGKLRVSGRDRVRFLNSLLSNDIKNLKPGSGCYATLLTRQGRLESDLYVYALEEECLLECSPAGRARLFESLNKYLVSDVVMIEDISLCRSIISVQGPGSRQMVERVAGLSLTGAAPLEQRVVHGSSGDWIVVRRDRTGCDGFDLWVPEADAVEAWERLRHSGRIRSAGHKALDLLRTEAGIPWFGVDMDENNLPLELGLTSAISMTKGCYRGQEIVARVTYRGHLDRRLGGVAIRHDEPPGKGAQVSSGGTAVGHVTSAVRSPLLGRPLALAILKTEFLTPGTLVEVSYEDKSHPGEVVSLPLGQSQQSL